MFLIFVVLIAALTGCGLFGGKKLGKTELTEEMVRHPSFVNSYVYTGEPIDAMLSDIQVYFDGEFMDMDLFDVEISDNVNPGTASIKVTAKKENEKLKGSVTLHFNIVADSSKQCNADDDLNALLADPGYSAVGVWCYYTINEGETLIIPEGQTLGLRHGYVFNNYGTIINNGTIVMEGAYMYRAPRRNTEFNNYGTLENHGTIDIKDFVLFNDLGAFTSDNDITNCGTVYLLDQDKTFLTNGTGGVSYVRTPATADLFAVDECVIRQGNYGGYTPAVRATVVNGAQYTCEYANNEHAGTAKVTVTMDARDSYYYGSVDVPFSIKKGQATASSLQALKELVSTGDFEQYRISALTIPTEDSFTLPADQTILVTGKLDVAGELNSFGRVECTTLNVAAGATLVNDGMLSVSGNGFTIAGTFKNTAHGDWTYENYAVQVNGTLLNTGTLLDKRIRLNGAGVTRNEGTLSISIDSYYSGTIENAGDITFLEGDTYVKSFRNVSGGVATLTGDVRFGTEFSNAGRVVNAGRVLFKEECAYSCGGSFDNSEGGVWSFAESLSGVSVGFYRKKHLTDSDVVFQAEYEQTYYNKRDQKPSFTVDGESLATEEYTLSYYSVSLEKYVQECVKTGSFVMRLSIRDDYSAYSGVLEHSYEIIPTTIHVASSYEYSQAASDDGYNMIVLDVDLELHGSYVSTGCTLDLNGHLLTIKGGYSSYSSNYFRVYGTLIGTKTVADPANFTPSEEAASVIVDPYAHLVNYGRIVNDGFIYVKGNGGFDANAVSSTNNAVGAVVNDGVIYTSSALTAESGSGIVVQRTSLTSVKSLLRVSNAVYDGTAQTPEPTMTYKNDPVDMARFTLVYSNNVNAGVNTAAVRLTVIDPFDPDFYGAETVYFEILRGTALVGTMADLTAAAADENYQTICLTGNITLNANVTLSENQTLDLASYDITQSGTNAITFVTGCRLILSTSDGDRLDKYAFAADEITLTGNIGTAGVRTAVNSEGYSVSYLTGKVNYSTTVVHLNGHSFVGGLSFVNSAYDDFFITFENSSEMVSTIGTGVDGTYADYNGYAFRLISSSKDCNVLLRNITIYGAHYGGGNNADVDLSAENCKFYASHSIQNAYALKIEASVRGDGTYTDCLFEGANSVYINKGRHYDFDTRKDTPAYFFNNCIMRAYGPHDASKNTDYFGCNVALHNLGGICLQIKDSYLYSAHGNTIQVNYSANNVNCLFAGENTYEHPEGNLYVLTPYYNH